MLKVITVCCKRFKSHVQKMTDCEVNNQLNVIEFNDFIFLITLLEDSEVILLYPFLNANDLPFKII